MPRRGTTTTDIGDALRAGLVSPNVSDSNFEPANLVDTTERIADGLAAVATAINNLALVAASINNLAAAVRDSRSAHPVLPVRQQRK